jgi:hypothetical protein
VIELTKILFRRIVNVVHEMTDDASNIGPKGKNRTSETPMSHKSAFKYDNTGS